MGYVIGRASFQTKEPLPNPLSAEKRYNCSSPDAVGIVHFQFRPETENTKD
jgi:hypothetical protein